MGAREIATQVRDALLLKEQADTLAAGGTVHAEAEFELADEINAERLPALRTQFGALRDMQMVWQDNDMAKKVEVAMKSGQPLAGYSAEDWIAWGTVFTALTMFLETPIETIGKSPRQVLNKRYIKQEKASE